MVRRLGLVGLTLSFVVASTALVATPDAHRHRRHKHRTDTPSVYPAYGRRFDPTPTCRYPDGTPYDPDIIGGRNHVGDGGPAANLGGFDPCGY